MIQNGLGSYYGHHRKITVILLWSRPKNYTLLRNNNEDVMYWKIRKRRRKAIWHAGIEVVVKNKLLKVGQWTNKTKSLLILEDRLSRSERKVCTRIRFLCWGTYSLWNTTVASRSRLLLEKLTVTQPLRKFSSFYVSRRRSVASFARACHISRDVGEY
jgi:hypothetical protein